ncbi:hypothetical protein [Halomarina pelagica]|uniref:DUF5789 family protein n=1 Tax=Halomarina pelagica TaxID=2961599 RepID=UPI0020C3840D|nr:hypothetical protein [Halomarina sp. BND7]
MRLSKLPAYLESEFEYPVDHETVLNQIGDATVDAPDDTDSETINEVLAYDNDEIYETPDDLLESIVGNLDDNYIGRKYYDDRGPNIEGGDGEYPHDERDQSF